MAELYDLKLCDERHERIDTEMRDVWDSHKQLRDSINGKFNKIMFGIFATLLTVIGSLITMLLQVK